MVEKGNCPEKKEDEISGNWKLERSSNTKDLRNVGGHLKIHSKGFLQHIRRIILILDPIEKRLFASQ